MVPETSTVEDNPSPSALSRRSVVRAGVGAVWAAPVVTLVTAAPALAVSSTLTIPAFSATYQNNPTVATVNPHILVVTATLGNTGSQATAGFQFTLSIPANLYAVAPTATTPAGFTGPVVSGSAGTGWTLTYTKVTQIAAGGSAAFSSTLTLGSTTATPWQGYRGSAFSLTGSATASNATSFGTVASVAATPNVALSGSLSVATSAGSGSAFTMTGSTVRVSGNAATNRSGIGQLFLAVSIPKVGKLVTAPTQGALHASWAQDGAVVDAGTAWEFKYKTNDLGYAGALGPNDASRGPVNFSSTLTMSGSGNPNGTATWTFTAAHLNTGTYTSRF